MHKYQNLILKKLLYNKGSRFSELNKLRITSDHFTFHLKKLIEKGLVIKKDNLYFLSTQGKEFANREARQAKLGVALNIYRDDRNGREYLIQKRTKEPFVAWYGTPSGKILFGESPIDSAQRVLKNEVGLMGNFELKGIAHHFRVYKDGTLLEDEYFWVFSVTNTYENLIKRSKGGINYWMTKEEINKIKNIFATFPEMEKFTNSKELLYLDIKKIVKEY